MALEINHQDFSFCDERGVMLLCNNLWRAEGFLHGMTTAALSFSQMNRSLDARRICEAFGAERLILLKQVHGRAVIDCRSDAVVEQIKSESTGFFSQIGEADAIILPRRQPIRGRRLLFGVLTADCVPIVLRSSRGLALIHAGWRGLAQGIIQVAAETLGHVEDGAVFACAGGDRYEVGSEVIQQLGSSAVFSPALMPQKFLLDTANSAMTQLRGVAAQASFVSAQICTISDIRFHSFRRDGDSAGRCLTFVCPSDAD